MVEARERQGVSPARRLAFDVLGRVEEDGAYVTPLLAQAADRLRPEDRALCHELVLGCLRQQLWLDRLSAAFARRSSDAIEPRVRRALRLGLYQLRFLTRVPASAAVNESVNLVRAAGLPWAVGFTNAVLRRAVREPDLDPAAGVSDPVLRLAIATSHPLWLIRRWSASLGPAEAEALARANNRVPPAGFRVARGQAAEALDRLRVAGAETAPSRVAPDGWRIVEAGAAGTAALRDLADRGVVAVQDEASQLVARVLGCEPGDRVLDVCAAPGSKTGQLASMGGGRALVIAGDRHLGRLRAMAESMRRQGLGSVHLLAHDAEQPLPFSDRAFDRVLADVPCSGTGTLRRNPEIRWRLAEGDIVRLAREQLRILASASRAVRAGGRMVYSTCSVEPEENEAVVAAFLAAEPGFERVPAAPAANLSAEGAARTWPHRDDVDGFFIAALRRR
jgi:16S rRNA (cytosine967-C5)-methyltransferase